MAPYAFAVYRGDVPPWLPYISDAGGDPPQSAVFSMGMALIGLMFVMGIYLCYLILETQNINDCKLITWLGKLLILAGFFMCIGLFGIATNPTGHLRRDGSWTWVVLVPHLLGAATFFSSSIGMMALLTFTTFLLERPNWLNRLFVSRATILMGSLLGGLLVLVGLPALSEVEGLKPSPDHGRVYPPGTTWSAFGEWLIVLTFMLFVATFIPMFRRTKITLVVDYKK
ncbi:DNA damage-regulated autophagy modulator protein 1-like [Tropilaelaps mercedesae]|uniref:DNA damage-regulated autophagy modulator protein 1-like n=1 Tax=Tropilaelaps mercedesae TaxID=418985 RepID=A0A1V9XP37_9ACAR|nr:DNA damage-regulated autophagy modulator protein 1-like [Tropilaelaps mercedesae]